MERLLRPSQKTRLESCIALFLRKGEYEAAPVGLTQMREFVSVASMRPMRTPLAQSIARVARELKRELQPLGMLVERGIHDVNDACVLFAAAISFLTAANIAAVVVSTKPTRQSY